jgi:hypothetical protein
VSFVVIGAFARVIHGTGELTDGIDITPSLREDNLSRLEKAWSPPGVDRRCARVSRSQSSAAAGRRLDSL